MKIKLIAAGFAILFAAASCQDKEKVALQGRVDSLSTELNERDTELNEYLGLVADIESNLNEIKERENIINLEKEKKSSDKASKKQIVDDLQAINALMLENKQKLNELNDKLKNSNYSVSKFQKLVASLESKVATSEEEIATLTTQVKDLTAQNQTLNIRVDSLVTETKTRDEILTSRDSVIHDMDARMHTAYYTAGTASELADREIIRKEGGLLGIGAVEQFSGKIDESQFTSVDIREVNSIPLNSKKVEIVTNHPQGSYEIVMNKDEKQVDKLVITDPEKFWASSKYLVLVKK